MSKTRLQIVLCVIAIGIGLIILGNPVSKTEEKGEVFLGGKLFSVEISDSEAERELGLSGHKPLNDSSGMMFVFQKPDLYGFWMKDMLFPIDIIWADENFRIVHIEQSVSPETYPKIFFPPTKSLYVLELSSGQSNHLKIKIGDTVVFTKKAV